MHASSRALALLAGLTAFAAGEIAAQAARPNIVVIMADDMGYSDIGAYGGEIGTPHLDRLAAGGLRFRQFYNEAVCSPTRAALLTGRYSYEVGMGGNAPGAGRAGQPGAYQGYLSTSTPTIAEALRAAGYRTYMSGKWHVGDYRPHWPRQRGFDRYFGLLSGATSFFELLQEPGYERQMLLENEFWTPPATGYYATDAYTDYAVERIREHRVSHASQPFFLYLAYTSPHFPLHGLEEDIARYKGRYDTGWDSLRAERYARMRKLGVLTDRHALSPRPSTAAAWKDAGNHADLARRMEVYAAMVDRMDQGIGRVVRALEETGAADNTLVLFLSDNGPQSTDVVSRGLNNPLVPIGARGSYLAYTEGWANVSATPFRLYKTTAHEGGIHTPLIAYWPRGIRARGTFTDHVGHVIDILPTALEVAGADFPARHGGSAVKPLEGRSLGAAFRGDAPADRNVPLFWARDGNWAIRQGDWKLAFARGLSTHPELFNLAEDPTELRDLSVREKGRASTLHATWREWAARVGVRQDQAD